MNYWSPGSLANVTGSEDTFLYLCPKTQNFKIYSDFGNEILDPKLMMEEVPIPPDSVFIVHPIYPRALLDQMKQKVVVRLSHAPDSKGCTTQAHNHFRLWKKP